MEADVIVDRLEKDFDLRAVLSHFAPKRLLDVKKIDDPEPFEDRGLGWSQKFESHMTWLITELNNKQCNILGRIMQALGMDLQKFVKDFISTAEDDSREKLYTTAVISNFRGGPKCNEAEARTLAANFLLRTRCSPGLFASWFRWSVLESDYDGCVTGIIEGLADACDDVPARLMHAVIGEDVPGFECPRLHPDYVYELAPDPDDANLREHLDGFDLLADEAAAAA
jgi:hypothetical protein